MVVGCAGSRLAHRLACLTLAVAWCAQARAQERWPLWEYGLGFTNFAIPYYRGSSEKLRLTLPFPYIVYRGDLLKLDEDGNRLQFFKRHDLSIEASGNATLPVTGDDVAARQGMSVLDATLELGAKLQWRAWQSPAGAARLDLRLPLRASQSLALSSRFVGLTGDPDLRLKLSSDLSPDFYGEVSLTGGVVYSSESYNAYFYSVGAADARPGRPAYVASGGYSGWQSSVLLSLAFGHQRVWRLGLGWLRDDLHGAVFADSPLVSERTSNTYVIALSRVLGGSRELAP